MAGKGPPPKPDHLRQRRNKNPTSAILPTEESALSNEVPELPARDGGWHTKTAEWWTSVWRSPMASEFLDSDRKGVLDVLTTLYEAFFTTTETGDKVKLASEIRLQEVRVGLSPIDRSRLRWTIEQGETAAERTEARREGKAPKGKPAKDPRSLLKVV